MGARLEPFSRSGDGAPGERRMPPLHGQHTVSRPGLGAHLSPPPGARERPAAVLAHPRLNWLAAGTAAAGVSLLPARHQRSRAASTRACPRCSAVLAERTSVFLAHGDATTRTLPDVMGVRAVPERPRGSPRVTPDKECVRMTITVEAISEAGVLKPLTPLSELPEHTKVRITVEALPVTVPHGSVIDEQRRP